MDDLPRLLRQAIENRKLTHAQVAAEVGVSEPQIGRWLAGSKPSSGARPGLAAFLGLTTDELDEAIRAWRGVPPELVKLIVDLADRVRKLEDRLDPPGAPHSDREIG